MNDTILKYQKELEENIRFIHLDIENPIRLSETVIEIVLKSMGKLKEFIIKYKFKDEQEEITFFKKIKPDFFSHLIYHNKIYNIETHKPHGGGKALRKYLNNELQSLRQDFYDNLEFYRYYRTCSEYLDHKYFLRGKQDIKLNIDSCYFDTDSRFSTSHDYRIAKIISNDRIQVYLEAALSDLDFKESTIRNPEISPSNKLQWTESKTSLIELIYALHSQATFENGKTEIKEIAKFFEQMFNIELGDYYRAFLELRLRKTDKTKFLNSLVKSLIERMDRIEEK